MNITAAQKLIFTSAVHGLAENAQESLKMGTDPSDYGVEHKDDLTWEMAVKHCADTLICAITDDGGIQEAMDDGYLFDEDENGDPTGLENLDAAEVEAFIKTVT